MEIGKGAPRGNTNIEQKGVQARLKTQRERKNKAETEGGENGEGGPRIDS